MVARVLVGMLALLAGCVAYTRDTRIVEFPAGTRHIDRIVDGSRSYHASAEIEGTDLVVTLAKVERCEVADVPLVRRVRITTKTEVPSPIGLSGELIAGIVGTVVGVAAIADPTQACTSNRSDGTASTVDPATCTTAGWGLVGVGASLLVLGVVDTVRGSDEQEPLDVVEGPYERSEQVCHDGPAAHTTVELQLGEHRLDLTGKTAADGVVRFSLLDAPSDLLPSPDAPAQLAVGRAVLALDVRHDQRGALFTHLLASPGSRVVADLADDAQGRCDRDVARARQPVIAWDDANIREARARWQRAQATCLARWTADHQRDRDASEHAILDNRVDTVVAALTANDLDRVDDVLAVHPETIAGLRDRSDVVMLLRRLVGEPTRAVAAAATASADARERLCRARHIFVAIRGEPAWRELQQQIAQNVSELDGTPRATIVRKMDAARCDP